MKGCAGFVNVYFALRLTDSTVPVIFLAYCFCVTNALRTSETPSDTSKPCRMSVEL